MGIDLKNESCFEKLGIGSKRAEFASVSSCQDQKKEMTGRDICVYTVYLYMYMRIYGVFVYVYIYKK